MISTQVAVCFEAAKRLLKPWEQILEPPLSADYVAERIVLAPSPPEGYVARERGEQRRMQGFVLICDFCTFSKSLRWTSTHPAALAGTFDVLPHERVARRRAAWPPRNASAAEVADGAAGCHRSSMEARTLRKVDDSGAVARALEATGPCDTREPRDKEYGDAISVWPKLAEVAVLGALGCGRRLLDKALADCAANDRHAHAVLHATKDAVKFYEKVGFVRVGAVSRFRDRADVPQLAYRHWTRRVDEVSYMMARPLSAVDDAPPPPVSRRRLSRRHALELVHTCMYGDVMAPGGATAFRECLLLAIGYASEGGAPDRPLALALAAALSVFRADIPDKTLSILRAKVLPALSNESDDDDDGAGDDDALRSLLRAPGVPWLGPPLLRARVAKRKVVVRLRSDSLVRAGVEIKLRGASRIRPHHNLHAIDATPARWRGDASSSPLDRARTAASSPRNDLVKNYRAPDTPVDFHTGFRRRIRRCRLWWRSLLLEVVLIDSIPIYTLMERCACLYWARGKPVMRARSGTLLLVVCARSCCLYNIKYWWQSPTSTSLGGTWRGARPLAKKLLRRTTKSCGTRR